MTFPADSAYVLPSDPMPALREAVLGALSVEACRLQPWVRVKDYPKGYFGDYERLGYLVMNRGESEEINHVTGLFKELSRSLDVHPDDYLYLESPALTLEDYSKKYAFEPWLLFVFHGTYETSVLVDVGRETAVILANHRAGFYHLNASDGPMLEYWASVLTQSPAPSEELRPKRRCALKSE